MSDEETARAIFDNWNMKHTAVTSMPAAEELVVRIAAALAAQRERDAMIAEETKYISEPGHTIAAAIRKGGRMSAWLARQRPYLALWGLGLVWLWLVVWLAWIGLAQGAPSYKGLSEKYPDDCVEEMDGQTVHFPCKVITRH